MKSATFSLRATLVLGLAAGLTVFTGLTAIAQDSTRTIATGSNIPLAENAPDEYVVKPGDTLWDISKTFLRDPWYWPEIWYVNPQIENPHLIYPGDVLKLVYIDGRPRLTIAERAEGGAGTKRLSPQVRREPLSRAIAAIPHEVIASFTSRPVLLDKSQVNRAPYVVAMRDGHVIGGAGNEIYARGIKDAQPESRFSIIHVEGEIVDPDTRKVLGYAGVYVGSGSVVTPGDPAKLMLTESTREALQGDKLFPESVEAGADFVPHAPEKPVDAAVIAVRDLTVMGQYHVIALNRGSRAGLEPGHVLAIQKTGDVVMDRYSKGGLNAASVVSKRGKPVQLPPERVGVAMIYSAYEDMSFALVMEATHEIHEGDRATNP
ncbi:MAG TPA: LysM peptidoglycan-binding domain-containing protein [Steroidobacteraceae bacterium]